MPFDVVIDEIWGRVHLSIETGDADFGVAQLELTAFQLNLDPWRCATERARVPTACLVYRARS